MEYNRLPWDYHNRNAKNREIATGLSWIVMHVLRDAPPSVPPRGEEMVSVLTSRKRKPRWERARHEGIARRYNERMTRRFGRRRYIEESDSGESSEEESIA